MRLTFRRTTYTCVSLMTCLVLYKTLKEDFDVRNKDVKDSNKPQKTKHGSSKNFETNYKKEDTDQNGFPISGAYSDIDNLKDNFIMKSRLKSQSENDFKIQSKFLKKQTYKMTNDIILPDKAWNGLGNVPKINVLPDVNFIPDIHVKRNAFYPIYKPAPVPKQQKMPERFQNVPPVNSWNSFIGQNKNIIPGSPREINKNMVLMPLPGKVVLPVVNKAPLNVRHSNPYPIEGNLHLKTQRSNPNPVAHNLPLKSPFAMKVADRRMGIIPQNPLPAGLKQNVVEIFPRKNEPIRVNMYMDHQGNVSYHHVNLLWEDGQGRPSAPIKRNNIKQVDEAQTQTKEDEVKYTLIMTYMRSGSTITSRLLKTNDTFFFFEPFQGLLRDHRTNQHVCYPHGYCRKPDGFWESSNGTVLLIKNLLSCNFMDVPVGAIEPLRTFSASSYQQEFKSCFPVNKTDWNHRLYTLSEYPEQYNKTCIERLQQLCLQSSHRLIKTIRMPGSFAEMFLSYIPNLKIVHLVRDPRGILNSRAQAHLIKYEDKEISIVSNHLCSRIWLDMQAIKRLQQDYPTRVYHVTYECLALYPEDTARMLYKDLSLDFTPELHDWLQMAFRSNAEQEFSLYKYGQSSSISQNWRSNIPVNANAKINQMCIKVFLELGLKKFSTMADLRDLRNPVFHNSRRTCLNRA